MAHVKVILSEDVPKLGDAGDLVSVRPGHARNFLLPQGKAILATAAKVAELEHHRRRIAEKVAKEMKDLGAANPLYNPDPQLIDTVNVPVGWERKLASCLEMKPINMDYNLRKVSWWKELSLIARRWRGELKPVMSSSNTINRALPPQGAFLPWSPKPLQELGWKLN